MNHSKKVILLDDEPELLKALSRLLRAEGFDVETHENAASFLAAPRPEGPACLLLDESMPGMTGSQLHQRLVRDETHIAIVFLTARGDIPMTVRAMKAGAVDFLTKPVKDKELLRILKIAMQRSCEFLEKNRELAELRSRHEQLTAREKEVLGHVASGIPNKQIAALLGLVEQTIKVHRGRVMTKMGADSFAQLVLHAEKLGLIASR